MELNCKEKVSIIIPIYNAERYLAVCLDSIIRQTYKNIEVILVDDGSTDESAYICDTYLKKSEVFKLIRQKNKGSAAARNAGLKLCTGQYISFLDADDWIDDDFLEILLHNIEKTGADISMCDFEINGRAEHNWEDEIIEKEDIFKEFLLGNICNRVTNKLYRAEIVKNIHFPNDRNLMEDGVWTARVLCNGKRIVKIKVPKYHYRMVESSITHKKLKSEKQLCGYFANIIERMELVFDNIIEEDLCKIATSNLIDKIYIILESGCNLSVMNVYSILKGMVKKHNSKILPYTNDYEKKLLKLIIDEELGTVTRFHCVNVLFKNIFPIQYKINFIKKMGISILRRM